MVQAGFTHGPNKKVDTSLLWTFGHVDSILKHWKALATLEAKLLNFLYNHACAGNIAYKG